jgi:hypothetical protein
MINYGSRVTKDRLGAGGIRSIGTVDMKNVRVNVRVLLRAASLSAIDSGATHAI